MISLSDLTVRYGSETALDCISLQIQKNKTCAIIGPSGCGKTTLLYTMAGLLSPDSGEVVIEGQKIRSVRRKTGVISQSGGLLPWKTARENVALGLKARGVPKNEIFRRVSAILEELGILEHQNKYPAQLSGGQKQRVSIARTLVLEPDLLLMDEASSSLDALTREHIQNLILRLYLKNPTTLVLVTHNIEEAVFLGQTIVIMERAAIKRVIENPYFGNEDIRSSTEYYHICKEVRSWLKEDAADGPNEPNEEGKEK